MKTNHIQAFCKKASLAVAFTLLFVTGIRATDMTTVNIGSKPDGTPVEATAIDFGKAIFNIVPSPDKDYVLVLFRDKGTQGEEWASKGEMGLFSLKSREMVWTMPFKYSNYVMFGKKYIYIYGTSSAIACDIQNGEQKWKSWGYTSMIDEINMLHLTYVDEEPGSSKVEGYNPETKQTFWKLPIPHNKCWGWNDIIRQDDSHIIVLANNLNRINLLTGEQQIIETKSGVIHAGKALGNALLWMGAGMVPVGGPVLQMGLFIPASVSRNATTALHSNICQRGELYYFADSERLICFDGEMNIRWSTDLPVKSGSHSALVLNNNMLYLFNYGYGLTSTGKHKDWGSAFMAVYDANTGKVQNNVQWDVEKYGAIERLQTDTVYTYDANRNVFLHIGIKDNCFPVVTAKGNICMMDEHLEVKDVIPATPVYHQNAQADNSIIVSRNEPEPEYWMIGRDGQPEMKLTVSINTLAFVGNILCIQNNDRLLLVSDK